MFNMKKFIALILLALCAFSLVNCAFLYGHSEVGCAENKLGVRLSGAYLTENYRDHGYDGSICYHAFSVNDELKKKLEKTLTSGVIPSEAKAICEASSHVNGKIMFAFPETDYGVYYYDYFNDGTNSRVCYALFDADNKVLYYFFASGQAIQYPNGR